MNIDNYGRVVFSENELFNFLYNGLDYKKHDIFVDNDQLVEKFNGANNKNFTNLKSIKIPTNIDTDIEEFDKHNQKNWFMPETYKNLDIKAWLINQCKTELEKKRVNEELDLFIDKDMIDLLKYLKFLVDTMRSNNIVWGVGRGSSVSSYCLYLLGVHKINSIKYELDIKEFLK